MVKVSVIIPTYNRAHCIESAISSAQKQSLKDIEILVCDDASTDDTEELVNALSEQDPRIKYHALEQNGGSGAARNLGMILAQGEYVAFLDSDDEWLQDKLTIQIARMNSEPSNVGVCFVGATITKNGDVKNVAYYHPDPSWETDAFLKFAMGELMFLTPTILFRRSCLQKVGLMKEEMRRNQDGEFLLRLLSEYDLAIICDNVVIVNLDMSGTRRHFDSVKKALPHRLANTDLVRRELGRWPAIAYRMNLYCNLVCSALAERRSKDALIAVLQRLHVFPVLFPKDILSISKALVRGYLLPLYRKVR